MNKRTKIAYLLIGILPASVLVMHGYIGTSVRLIADDFCSVYFANSLGLLRSIWYWRLNWSGRYSAFAADWLLAKTDPIYSLPLVTSTMLLLWVFFAIFAILIALRAQKPGAPNRMVAALSGLLLVFGVLTITPSIPQSLYWWNGMRSYTLPLIGLTFAALLFQLRPEKFKSTLELILWAAGSFFVLFLNGGLGETYAVFQFSTLVFLILLQIAENQWKKNNTGLILSFAGLLGTIASIIAIISAPGNAIRQDFNPPPTWVNLVIISINSYFKFMAEILLAPEKITGFVGAMLFIIVLGAFYPVPFKKSWHIPAYLFGGLLLSLACFPPGVYGYADFPPYRTLVIACFGLTGFFFYAAFLGGQRLSGLFEKQKTIRSGVIALAVALMGFSALMQVRAIDQESPVYSAFAKSWDENNAKIEQARAAHAESVLIENPGANNWTGLNVLNDNPKFWVNICYSKYYGIPVFGPSPDPP